MDLFNPMHGGSRFSYRLEFDRPKNFPLLNADSVGVVPNEEYSQYWYQQSKFQKLQPILGSWPHGELLEKEELNDLDFLSW